MLLSQLQLASDADPDELVVLRFGEFKEMMKACLADMEHHFDEHLYAEMYPDIRPALAEGAFASGFEHFVQWGYWELRRFPWNIRGREAAYRARYADLAHLEDVELRHHFVQDGYDQGRVVDDEMERVQRRWRGLRTAYAVDRAA